MGLFERLALAVTGQNRDSELPDFLVPRLMEVAQHPERYAGRERVVEELLKRVEEYETFSNVCCEKIGFSLEDIEQVLAELQRN